MQTQLVELHQGTDAVAVFITIIVKTYANLCRYVGIEGRCQFVTCSGAQKDSSLPLVRDQIEVKEQVCLILAFNFFWTSAFCSHTDTNYVFLSYASG